MDRYLIDKFKGKYRVMAHLDQSTNDFPRNFIGEVDEDFADFYIKCQSNIEIKHGSGRKLMVYIPSKVKGYNILKKMYEDACNKKWSENDRKNDTKYYDNLVEKVINATPVIDVDVMDYEVTIDFNIADFDWMRTYVKPTTSGANISPLSRRNLYKTKYTIPAADLEKYKEIENTFPHREVVINGKKRSMIDGLFVRKLNNDFELSIDNMSIDEIYADKKLVGLTGKEYYHKKGWWEKYLNFCIKAAKH